MKSKNTQPFPIYNDEIASTDVLRKPIQSIVMIPAFGRLTAFSRKLINALFLKSIQEINEFKKKGLQVPAGHYFSATVQSLEDLVRKDIENNRFSIKKHLAEFRDLRVNWESPDLNSATQWINFDLLSEVVFTLESNKLIAKWSFPPSIFNSLSIPGLYAQIKFDQISKLDTYCSVALYEIVARYRDNSVTCDREEEWWVQALSQSLPAVDPETKKLKWRPFRNFKYEHIDNAINEINSKTDLNISMVRRKASKKDAFKNYVQFTVSKNQISDSEIKTSDLEVFQASQKTIDLALQALISPEEISSVVKRGIKEIHINFALSKMIGMNPEKIENKMAYLYAILKDLDKNSASIVHASLQQKEITAQVAPPASSEEYFKENRRLQVKDEFLSLGLDVQKVFAEKALAVLKTSNSCTETMIEKVSSGQWKSSRILFAKIIDLYAEFHYGKDWLINSGNFS
jgi:Initiator Replication protein